MDKNTQVLLMFGVIVLITLGITFWASQRNSTAKDFYAAGREISGAQNGIAVAGDYMSAASFLGIAGLIAANGYDGFMYSVGFLLAYLTVLFLVAEPLRNTGKFTMADVLAFRLRNKTVRAVAAISTLVVTIFYMIAQMIGAGSLINLLIPQFGGLDESSLYNYSIIGVGILMIAYVIFGGMRATTWVQIVKAVLLMGGAILLSTLVLAHFNWSFGEFFAAVQAKTKSFCADGSVANATTKLCKDGSGTVTRNFLQQGIQYHGTYGQLDLISLGLALILGTAGLPHILMRFYTVPTAKAARSSVVWATILIGGFYLLTTLMGYGAATILPKGTNLGAGNNLAAPLLAENLGGSLFLAFIAAVAFATILAVVAGLTIAGSSAFAHDIWLNIVRNGKEDEREQVIVAKVTAAVVGLLAIVLAIGLRTLNVAFLVALAFCIAAAANVPSIILSLTWKRFNTTGMIVGMLTGLISTLVLISLSPSIMTIDPAIAATKHLIQANPIFPLTNPGLITIPLGFLGCILGSLLRREAQAEALFSEVNVRANTGMAAEV